MILEGKQAEWFQPHKVAHQDAIVERTPAPLRSPKHHVDLSTEEVSHGDSNPAAEPAKELDLRCRPASFLNQEGRGQPLTQCVHQERATATADLGHHLIVEGQELACRREESTAGGGQRHVPAGAVEKFDPEDLLQPTDVSTHRLLGQIQPRRRPGEVKLLGYRHEGPQEPWVEIGRKITHGLSIHTGKVLILLGLMLDSSSYESDNGGRHQIVITDLGAAQVVRTRR